MFEKLPSQPEQSVLAQSITSSKTYPCRKRLQYNIYTIGWICALSKKQTAVRAILDKKHESLPKPRNNHDAYILSLICGHNIVIACLPNIRTSSATTVATSMINTFQSIRFGLMIGIDSGNLLKVNLEDMVVSRPVTDYHRMVQWDMRKLE